MSRTSESRPTYVLGTREQRFFLNLGPLELGVLIASLFVAFLLLISAPTPLTAAIAVGTALGGCLLAWFPVYGRSGAEWGLVGVRWFVAGWLEGRLWQREAATIARRGRLEELVDLPGELGRLELWEAFDAGGASVGVLRDRTANTYAATLLVRASTNWALEGEDVQAAVAAQYGTALIGLAKDRTAIDRIAWYERTLPEPPDALIEDLRRHRAEDVDFDDAVVRSYLELLEGAGRQADHHELLITVRVSGKAARAQARRRGWERREAGFRVLLDELALVSEQLNRAQMEVGEALTSQALLRVCRTVLDPWSRAGIERSIGDGDPSDEDLAPTARREEWSRVICDGSQHAVLWVEKWPRMRVGPGFLDDLLVESGGAVRTVAMVMEIVGPERGFRRAEHDVTDAEAQEGARQHIGRRTSSRIRRRDEARYDHEDELALGHVATRYAGFCIVSAPGDDPATLEAEVDRITLQASSCNLRVSRVYGAQASALTFGLPLARGLR